MRRIPALLALWLLAACASAQLTAFRDPNFSGPAFHRVAVFGLGMYVENAVEAEGQLCKKIAPEPCVSGHQVVPPIRNYSTDEINGMLTRAGVDGVLMVVLGDDQTVSRYLGTSVQGSSTTSQTGSVGVLGNTAQWGATTQTNTMTTATAEYANTRKARAAVVLVDRATGKTVWGGELSVGGQGYIGTSDKEFIRASTNEIAAKLKASQLLSGQ